MYDISSEILDTLKEFFPNDAESLIALILMRFIYQNPLKRANLEKSNLTKLLMSVGKDREAITNFMHKFIEGS